MMTHTILVVDDSQIMREMLRMILTKAGYELIFAQDGKEAVEKAAVEQPDVVIIDGLLPKLHGFLACKAMKEQQQSPKVVLLTGVYKKPSYRWEVKRDFHADELLVKPVRQQELLACLDKLLGRTGGAAAGGPQAFVTKKLVPQTDFEICESMVTAKPPFDAVA